eukprot:CAMPEP_0174255854 /NCGR_PEP_ID=MMETSP0439-20130205/5149_1 /TAXON_ID=0 /ORGANISM="Stereomyxa ramosa, Strain Chinc5" /LENGTH=215 /DNA_ID=CAMNT_0015338223 /DNA_START=112 /DNA_END=759 /DNA_ORIENTATION=-
MEEAGNKKYELEVKLTEAAQGELKDKHSVCVWKGFSSGDGDNNQDEFNTIFFTSDPDSDDSISCAWEDAYEVFFQVPINENPIIAANITKFEACDFGHTHSIDSKGNWSSVDDDSHPGLFKIVNNYLKDVKVGFAAKTTLGELCPFYILPVKLNKTLSLVGHPLEEIKVGVVPGIHKPSACVCPSSAVVVKSFSLPPSSPTTVEIDFSGGSFSIS